MASCAQCSEPLPKGARFCPACAAPVDAPAQAEERKLATVLFADLVGSTALGEAQDPERTRVLLDRFYDAMASEIAAAGGTVEKFAGDAVMAAFGAPAALEDHAERALHAALAMQRRLAELFGERLALRVGVNTGEVVVGRPREGSSFVTGDAVNVAARLEQAAAPSEILVGERTVAAARGAFEFDELRTVKGKGKSGGVRCRRVVRRLSLMRPRGVGGLRRVFVGRDAELELLQATYHRVATRSEPHLVTIMGDAGVGKTRLVRELWELLGSESPEPLRRTGRCLPYGQGITYWPLGDVLKEHLGLLESDPPEVVRQRLGERDVLGLTLGLDVASDLHPLAARDRLHEAWVELLGELAAELPTVVLVEDLHWAEEPLLELLERLTRDVHGRLLLLGTARPELLDRRPAWGAGRRNASLLWLEPLSADESERMVEEMLAATLPPRLAELVVARAEGNPFFVEELIATLIDRGFLERRDGGWQLRELPGSFEIPDSIQAVAAARIDLLDPREKAALQAAAVIGRIFWTEPVGELAGGEEPDWRLLEDRDFVRHRSGSSMARMAEYAFKHALTREVAYASLPKARRARLHAAFADWLERYGEGRDEHAAFLAHHYAEAVRPEDADLAWGDDEDELDRLRQTAVAWLRRAAELAVRRYDIDEALALLHRGLQLGPSEAVQAEVWREIGHANALKFDGDAFLTAMQNSLKVCRDRVTCGATYSELAFQTSVRSGMWPRRPASELVQGWIRQALELAEPGGLARAKALIAQAYWDPRDAAGAAQEASAIAERLGDVELRSSAFEARATTAFARGSYQEALEWEGRRFDLSPEISDPDHLAEIHVCAIPPAIALGRLAEARRLAAAHDRIVAELTPHHRMHGVGALLEVEELAGGWEAIADLQERAERAVEANQATPCVRNPRSLLVCALSNAHLGRPGEARRLETRADELRMEGHGPRLDAPRARLALLRGDLGTVERLVAEPIELTGHSWFFLSALATRLDALAAVGDRARIEEEAARYLVPGTYLEPFALRALGLVREDQRLVDQAVTRFEALGLEWHVGETRRLVEQP